MLLRAARAAAVAVVVGWGLVVALTVLGWVAAAGTTAPLSAAVGVGSVLWSVAHLGAVGSPQGIVSLVPLGLVAWPLLVVARCVRSLGADLDDDRSPRVDALGGLRRLSAAALATFLATYVVLGLAATLVGRVAPVQPVLWRSALGSVLVALVGMLVGLRHRLAREDAAPLWRDQLLALAPVPVRRGVRVGLRGAALLLLAGLVPVVATVAVHLDDVRQVHSELAPGAVGGVLLWLLQALLVPNLSAWGLAWLAGPGFGVGTGSGYTWTHSSSVLLPNIPLLGALPQSGSQSWAWALAGLVPVLVGAGIGHAALRTLSRLSPTRSKVQVVGVAVLTAALACLVALVASGGSLGSRALAQVGPHALPAAAALLAEVAVGAGAALGASLWRFNRR